MKQDQNNAPKFYHSKAIVLQKRDTKQNTGGVILELNRKNPNYIDRVSLATNEGTITWRPKKVKVEMSEVLNIPTRRSMDDPFTIQDLETKMPHILDIAKLSLKQDVELVMSYTEKDFFNETEKETETYRYMMNSQAELIYCSETEKNDDKLIKQAENKEKYKKVLGE